MACAGKRFDFRPLSHWTGGRVCEDRSCPRWRCAGGTAPLLPTPALLGGRKACNRRLGPTLGKISSPAPALPTKHCRYNPAHLNLFSWGRCLSVDRRRCHVSCGPGDKSHRLPRMPCPPQEKGLFCLLFVAVWTKSKASAGRDPRSCFLPLALNTIQSKPKTRFAGPGGPPANLVLLCQLVRD